MPGSAATYQATHLDPVNGTVKGFARYRIAGALYQFRQKLLEGATPVAAQAYVMAQKRHQNALSAGQVQANNNATVTSDFTGLDAL